MELYNSTDAKLISGVKSGGEEEIISLYNQHKSHFIKWAKNSYKIEEDDARDIFQDAIIAFYKNIKQEKITEFKFSAKTYLYAIAKNIIYTKLKYEKRFDDSFDEFDKIPADSLTDHVTISDDTKDYIKNAIKSLGEPCYTLLKLYYYDQYSMEAISREIKSKSANVVKAQKARCIKTLRMLIQEKFKNGDLQST